MSNNYHKKYKRPKQKTFATTNPDAPRIPPQRDRDYEDRSECPEHVCPLLAKDSEWVDILNSPFPNAPAPSSSSVGDEESLLQLVDCEDGPESKPLAIMFPGLLEQDPQTFEGMLTKAMSTTEVTRHLVDLGAKANFQFMKKSNKLIPRDKQWLEKVTEFENSNSHCSIENCFLSSSSSSREHDVEAEKAKRKRKLLAQKKVSTSKENVAESSLSSPSTHTLTPDMSSHSETNLTEGLTVAALVIAESDHSKKESGINNVITKTSEYERKGDII